jgi:hypothetical protein
MEPSFADYQRQIVANATAAGASISSHGFRLVSGGTDNHLMLVDVFSKGITGKDAEAALGQGWHHGQQERDSRSSRTRRWSRAASASARRRSPRAACASRRWTHRRSDRARAAAPATIARSA